MRPWVVNSKGSAMQKSMFLRKQFLVNKPYQLRFIAEVMIVIILATSLSTGAIYVLLSGEMESGFHSSEQILENVREALPRILGLSAFVIFISMALMGGFITLRETHRVIGPAGKMEKKFREMAEGNFDYMIPFRNADVLKGLDESINVHLNNLSDFFITFEKTEREIVPLLGALESSEGDTEKNIAKIRKLMAELGHYAEAFR